MLPLDDGVHVLPLDDMGYMVCVTIIHDRLSSEV